MRQQHTRVSIQEHFQQIENSRLNTLKNLRRTPGLYTGPLASRLRGTGGGPVHNPALGKHEELNCPTAPGADSYLDWNVLLDSYSIVVVACSRRRYCFLRLSIGSETTVFTVSGT